MTDTKPTIDEQIAYKKHVIKLLQSIESPRDVANEEAILASLKELQSIRSAELPVEPDEVTTLIEGSWSELNAAATRKYIDTLKSALQVAQQEREENRRQADGYYHEAATAYELKQKAESKYAALREKVKYYESITTGAEHRAVESAVALKEG